MKRLLWGTQQTEERGRRRRTYFIVKNESFIALWIITGELIFTFIYISFHIFEKGPCVAAIPLTDTAPETSKGERTVSQTAERVGASVLLVRLDGGKGAQDRARPVQSRAAGAGVVDWSGVERMSSILLEQAFNAAAAGRAEVAPSERRLLLQNKNKREVCILHHWTFKDMARRLFF